MQIRQANGGDFVEGWEAFQGGAFGASALEVFVRVAEVVRIEARGVGVDVADVEAVDGDAARASSNAKSRTMLSSAAFAAPSTPWPGKLRIESIPEIIRTRPPSPIILFASCTAATNPLTLSAKVRARLCGLVSSIGLNAVAAALAIRMSRRPSFGGGPRYHRTHLRIVFEVGLDEN